MNIDFKEITRYATKAPSGHNTQPWKFRITNDTITVIPDLTVALPVVDGDNRQLFISLGCATENLCIAAGHFGYETYITEQNEKGISIKLAKNHDIVEDPLFFQIEKRQTNRNICNGDKISGKIINRLQTMHREIDIQIYFIETDTLLAETITEHIMRGNEYYRRMDRFGRTLQRFLLKTNEVGIACAFLNQPCELRELKKIETILV